MERSYTPPPWRKGNGGEAAQILADDAGGGPCKSICELGYYGMSPAERRANGRLIVMAPALLQAAEDLCLQLNLWCNASDLANEVLDAQMTLEEAIRQAGGQA